MGILPSTIYTHPLLQKIITLFAQQKHKLTPKPNTQFKTQYYTEGSQISGSGKS